MRRLTVVPRTKDSPKVNLRSFEVDRRPLTRGSRDFRLPEDGPAKDQKNRRRMPLYVAGDYLADTPSGHQFRILMLITKRNGPQGTTSRNRLI